MDHSRQQAMILEQEVASVLLQSTSPDGQQDDGFSCVQVSAVAATDSVEYR